MNIPTTSSIPHIALFVYSLDGGGAERVMANLACSFARRGFKVDLLLVKVKGPYLEHIEPTVRVIDLEVSKTLDSLWPLVRYLRQAKPDILLSAMHYVNEVSLVAKRLAKVSTKLIVTEHNTLSRYAKQSSRKAEKLTPLWAKIMYPWADGIVAVSKGVAQDLAKVAQLPPSQIQVIYNPLISPELLVKAKEPITHPWFVTRELPIIVGVGRLVGQKDFSTLIRAFAVVQKVYPSRLMILGGSGGNQPTLKALIHELKLGEKVAMPGFVSNPYAYLAQADLFVLSSRWEGFGNVLVEAMAVGTPIVSTNCESGPAEILDHGKYGTLVPVGDEQAMATAILNVLSGKTQIKVDPTWLSQFNLDTITDQYLKVMNIMPSQTTMSVEPITYA